MSVSINGKKFDAIKNSLASWKVGKRPPGQLSLSQFNELDKLKRLNPDKFVFAVIDKKTGNFTTHVKSTDVIMHRRLMQGHRVYRASMRCEK